MPSPSGITRVLEKASELQVIMDALPVRIAQVDASEHYLYVNRAHALLYGGDPAAIIGRTIREVLGEEAYAKSAKERARAFAGHTVAFERQQRGPDGQERTLSIVLVPDVDSAGRTVGYYSVSTDVTDRKHTEEALRATVSLLSATLESTADGLLVVGSDHRISQFNQRFVEMWRIPRDIVESRDDDRALGFALEQLTDPAAFLAKVKDLYAHPEAESFDTLDFKDGRTFERYSRPQYVAGKPVGRVWSFRDVTQRKQADAQIHSLAYHDVLTELPNRLLLKDRMQQAMAQADRARTKVAFLFLDLDNFKTINDSLGHAVGDALLQHIAKVLRGSVRDTDTVSRQGGDEFLIMLTNLSEVDAATPVLQKIMEQFQGSFVVEENELNTTVSIGIAVYPDDGRDFEALLKKADTAMYRAKDAGKNVYRFFDAQMNVEAVEHLAMRNGLRHALKRDELVLHYQPQFDLHTGALVGAEALVRWNHPQHGLVAPERFIPIAEESSLIVPIGEWVLREASRAAAAWREAGWRGAVVAVNLSAVQFIRGGLEESVGRAIADSGIEPSMLELELTESILIHDTEATLATVKRLKSLGLRLSIDDFGTGYSSLSYLKRFEVDKLKIDQSFIRTLRDNDPEDATIVRSIIQMAHSLGLRTIAEGVEHEDLLPSLRAFRCDEAQGYYFARPMPADVFATFLGARGAKK
ncbi:MAG: putative bifunctional diguanylate cyclase/phosphodiesterase [Clostridia bacterium]